MPKVSAEYRSAKRDEIALAAKTAFLRRGFHATSMADIIAESGLSAGAIYGHYRSKEEIVIAVAHRAVGARMDEVTALAAHDPMPAPATLIRVLMRGVESDMGGTSLLVQLWGEAVTDPEILTLTSTVIVELRDTYRGYISLWQQRAHGLSPVEADEIAAAQCDIFVGAAQGYILQSALIERFDAEAYFTAIEKYLPR